MSLPEHWLRLIAAPTPAVPERIDVLTRRDIQWGTPVFRAPALPTPNQLSSELPFTAGFHRKLRRAS